MPSHKTTGSTIVLAPGTNTKLVAHNWLEVHASCSELPCLAIAFKRIALLSWNSIQFNDELPSSPEKAGRASLAYKVLDWTHY